MLKERIIGLDIGSSTVRAIAGDFVSGRPVEFGAVGKAKSSGIYQGVVVDIYAASKAISQAVGQLGLDTSSGSPHVIANISGKQIASLNSSTVLPITRASRRISADDLEAAGEQAKVIVLPPDREIIHFMPRGCSVDGQSGIVRPVGLYGSRLEYSSHIVTSSYSQIHNVASAIREADIELGGAVPTAIAVSEAVLRPEEKKLGVLVVDIGDGATDLTIFSEGFITYTSSLPIGGAQISADIAAMCDLSTDDAELYKRTYQEFSSEEFAVGDLENGAPADLPAIARIRLSEVIIPRMEQIVNLVRHELIKSGTYGILPAGVVISGGGAQLCGTAPLFGRVLKMPARIGYPLSIGNLPANLQMPEYATVVGLSLYGAAHPKKRSPKFENSLEGISRYLKSVLVRLSGVG